MGSGREFSVFDSRGGSSRPPPSSSSDDEDEFMERYRKTRSAGNKFKIHTNMNSRIYKRKPQVIQTVQNWWASSIRPSFKNWPKMVCRVEPTTTLKLRKTFRPLKTIVRLGADFNTQLGVWQFQSSWEDAIIGGTLTLIGKELQLTKSWQLSVGKQRE